jgi:hypothetical protein
MTDIFQHPLFANLGQVARNSDLYAQLFQGVEIEIMGESPYLNQRDAGVELCLSKKHKIEAIHLYGGKFEDFGRYQGSLHNDISFDTSRIQVHHILGTPAMSMEPGGIGLMAIDFAFDRYEDGQYYVRFQYEAGNDAIQLITLGMA